MKKEKNLMDKPIDIIKIFSLIYHNQKFIVNTTILFFVIGIIYSLTLQNIYKSSSTFYPHYENVNESNDLQSLAGLAGINIQNTNTNISKDFVKNMTLSSIFHIIGTHEKYLGLFDKISYFKCQNCNKLTNEIIYSENLTCLKCFNNL